MSELRVDNIVSQNGSAAPVYSRGIIIGAGGGYGAPDTQTSGGSGVVIIAYPTS